MDAGDVHGHTDSGARVITTIHGSHGGEAPLPAPPPTPHRTRWLWVGVAALPLAIGLAIAVRDAWVCDDAFITFRYVDHFDRGLGLVFNAGERVEGYTHFLWVVLLAALHRLSFDLVELGRYLPIVFHVATLGLLCGWSWRQRAPGRAFLPIAAWGVALHRDQQIWASGGLETAAFTFCVTAAVLAAASRSPRAGLVATFAALAALFRPEGVLVSAAIAGWLVWQRPGRRALVTFAATWLALVVPLVVWRLAYYHDWLPNTFYAKSASAANWSQGWRYTWLYFATYPVLMFGLGAAIAATIRNRGRNDDPRPLVAVVGSVFLVYILRVGGDFMFARFLVPITPLLYVAIEATVARARPLLRWAGAGLVVGSTVAALFMRERLVTDRQLMGTIADEYIYYPRTAIEERQREGEALAATFRGLDVHFCILGAQASVAYFARYPYVFEKYGLTDREFARRKITQRGRPGHERGVLRRDLIDRRVHFFIRGKASSRSGVVDEVVFGDLLAAIVHYDRALMDSLRGRPGVVFVDFPAYLDTIVTHVDQLSPEERSGLWAFADGYYFQHNVDPARQERARRALLEN